MAAAAISRGSVVISPHRTTPGSRSVMLTRMDFRVFTEPQQGATYDDLLAVARKTEECGYDAFFRSDHYLVMGGGDGLPGPTDAWVTLAGLARDTSRIRLGTLLTCGTFRLPGPLAISVAEVDAMSGGRVELGLGAGWYDAEHRAYGVPFPPLRERFDRLEEQLAIITGLWRTPIGKEFAFDGTHYSLSNSPALPKPVQDPIPVIVGGHGAKRTPARAGCICRSSTCTTLIISSSSPRRLHSVFPDRVQLPFSPANEALRENNSEDLMTDDLFWPGPDAAGNGSYAQTEQLEREPMGPSWGPPDDPGRAPRQRPAWLVPAAAAGAAALVFGGA